MEVFLGLKKWRKDVAIMPSEYAPEILMEIIVWIHSVFTKKTCSLPSRQQTDRRRLPFSDFSKVHASCPAPLVSRVMSNQLPVHPDSESESF